MNQEKREHLTPEEEEKLKKKFEQKERVTENQVHTIVQQAKAYFINLEHKAPEAIKEIWAELILLYEMLKDWSRGEYQAPWKTISAVAFTLAYVMNPLDIVPDFIPLLGYLDDATLVKMTLDFIHDDIQKYKATRKNI